MVDQSQIRSRSWNRMPTKRCTAKSIRDEFVVVDDDEVIILDFPESSKCKTVGTSRNESEPVSQRVIIIDDDEAGSSSNRNSRATNLQTSAEVDDDCQFIREKHVAFKYSKRKKCLFKKASSGFRFGLRSKSENDSDCEIFEGSNREVREQWEKAFLKKTSKAASSDKAGPSNFHCETNFGPCFESRTDGGKETSSSSSGTDSRNPNTPLFDSNVEEDNEAINSAGSSFCNREDFPRPSSLSPKRFDSQSTQFTSSKERIHQSSFKEVKKHKDMSHAQYEASQSAKKKQKRKAAYQSSPKEVEEGTSKSSPISTSNGYGSTMPAPEIDTESNGARLEREISSLGQSGELILDRIPSTSGRGINDVAPPIDVMLGREKHKETDEYKKAQEEEWESRQHQLKIQEEEAQRERKRRKLEHTRKLEVERRQKERVEEVRETKKKDEESMNMKDKFRTEITKSLKLLELKSINMASLLRGLGIHVGGGTFPLPHEVHVAYKRAVLKFHPDRTSRGDIKQQVEAEEKFKLISRMKDKFVS